MKMRRLMGKIVLYGFIGFLLSCPMLYWRYGNDDKINAKRYRLDTPPELEGKLAVNDELSKVSYILKDQILGPESFVINGTAIYASLYDARVVKIVDHEIVSQISYSERAKFFQDCGNFDAEPTCGRPLGIRRLVPNTEKFIVADAYLGIFIIDFTDERNPTYEQVYDIKTPINGIPGKFLNDLDVLNEDEIIVSESSTKYDRRHFMTSILEHTSDGRIFHYKISTKKATVLQDNLYFVNGVQLMPDKKSLLFAETSYARVKRLWIDSKKVELFTPNLPGLPDNIRKTDRDTFWVGLAATRYASSPSFIDHLGAYPGIRQFLVDVVPSKSWEFICGTFKTQHPIVVELDIYGNIIRSLHDPTSKAIGDSSQVTEYNNKLYFGSFNSPYLATLDLKSE